MATFYRHTTQNAKARVGVAVPGSWAALPGAPLPSQLSGNKNCDSAHFHGLRKISIVTSWKQALNNKKSPTCSGLKLNTGLPFRDSTTWTAPTARTACQGRRVQAIRHTCFTGMLAVRKCHMGPKSRAGGTCLDLAPPSEGRGGPAVLGSCSFQRELYT